MPRVDLTPRTEAELNIEIASLIEEITKSGNRYITILRLEQWAAAKYGWSINQHGVFANLLRQQFKYQCMIQPAYLPGVTARELDELAILHTNEACNCYDPVGLVLLWRPYLFFTHESDIVMFKLLLSGLQMNSNHKDV